MRPHGWLIAALTALLVHTAHAGPVQRLVVLSDSLSDTGNLSALAGIPPSPPYAPGRFSNGDLWTDVAGDRLGLVVNPALVGGPQGIGFVDNFSVAGSFAGTYDLGGGVQVSNVADLFAVLGGGAPSGIPGLTQQLGAYAGTGLDAAAAHVVWAGSNDLLYSALIDPSLSVSSAALESFADDVALAVFDTVAALQGAGAERVVVASLPDLGQTPLAGGTSTLVPAIGTTLLGIFGTEAALRAYLTDATDFFNAELSSLLAGGGPNAQLFDARALVDAALASPAAFGLANTDDACLAQLVPSPVVCGDPGSYLFWDDVHPTAAAHAVLGDRLALAVPEPGALALVGLGLAVLPWWRRRVSR